jgi:nucleotide-binding universal stress UspA family protein
MKRILVATDGSEGAFRAVEFAAQLAKQFGTDLVAANVIGGYGLPGEVVKLFTSPEHAWLNEMLQSLSARTLADAQARIRELGVPSVRLESRQGDVAQTIIAIADDVEADTIVVGKRGSGQVAGLLLGSVSQKLVSLASRIVIVVP